MIFLFMLLHISQIFSSEHVQLLLYFLKLYILQNTGSLAFQKYVF